MIHLNTYGLLANGFQLVAIYECFTKGERKLNIECYTNGGEYLVRSYYSGRRAWDNVYDNKDDANAKVKELFKLRAWHKRVF